MLARSAFHHSMNYRSVMAFGRPQPVIDEAGKEKAVMAILEHLVPGRTADTRPPTSEELRATLVVRFPLDEASAKVRTGPPLDEPEDLALPHWAGVIPLSLVRGPAVPDGQEARRPPRY